MLPSLASQGIQLLRSLKLRRTIRLSPSLKGLVQLTCYYLNIYSDAYQKRQIALKRLQLLLQVFVLFKLLMSLSYYKNIRIVTSLLVIVYYGYALELLLKQHQLKLRVRPTVLSRCKKGTGKIQRKIKIRKLERN